MTKPVVAFVLLALAAACGGDDPVAVVVTDLDGPIEGAEIVFHDRDGAPVARATTGADGRASADVDGGGMVTLLFDGGGWRLRGTIMGVERGDELAMQVPRTHVTQVGVVHVLVTPFAGAGSYVFRTACAIVYTASIGEPVPIEIRSNCLAADGTLPLLVVARDGAGDVMAVTAEPALRWTEPMNVVMPAWSAPSVLSLAGTAAPAGASGLTAELGYAARGAFLDGDYAGVPIAPGQSIWFALPYAPGFGDRLEAQLSLVYGSNPDEPDGSSMLIRRMAAPIDVAVDLSAEMLPRIPVPTNDTSTIGRPAMTWPVVEVADADGGTARFVWNEGAAGHEDWRVVMPPDMNGRVQAPELPAELASWAPPAGATFAPGIVQLVDAGWLSSYRELRETIGFTLAAGDRDRSFPDADATLRITAAGDL